MYTKYHTDAFVLASYPRGEADRSYALFTQELGLVYAHARSVRELHSKQRAGLQTLSHAHMSLVRGKDVWRITNVSLIAPVYQSLSHTPAKLTAFANIMALVRRLVRGQEQDRKLYTIVHNAFLFLKDEHDSGHTAVLEILTVLRILYTLGYLKEESTFQTLLTSPTIDHTILSKTHAVKQPAIAEINRALHASQL